MELWIRSQNRSRLVKANDIITITHSLDPNYHNYQMYVGITYIGEYKTEERALEILDEIQNMIHYEYNFENLNYEKADLILKGKIVENLVKFYEMPKE